MNDKFVLYAARKSGQFRPIMLTEETYQLLQQIKEKTHMPLSSIAELAIEFALSKIEIRERTGEPYVGDMQEGR